MQETKKGQMAQETNELNEMDELSSGELDDIYNLMVNDD